MAQSKKKMGVNSGRPYGMLHGWQGANSEAALATIVQITPARVLWSRRSAQLRHQP